MDLLQLKYFKDAAFFENFSKAAEVNYIPQSSISKAVKNLEKEYNVALFDRIGRNIYLNDNGRFLYQEVCSIFDKLDSCSQHFDAVKPYHIIIYIQDSAFFVPLLSADYMESHPNTHITFSPASEVLHSTRSPYDLTFMPLLDDMSNYHYEHLLSDNAVLLVSKDNPLSQYDEIELSQIKEEPFVSFYWTMWLRTLTHNLCVNTGGFRPNIVFETHDEFSVIHLVSKNLGVTILPQKLYNVHPHTNVKAVKIKNTIQTDTVLAWNKHKHLSSAEKSFIGFSKKWFQKLPSFASSEVLSEIYDL